MAVWRDGAVGAILSIWHDPEDDEEPFAQDVTVFELVDGAWTWRSRGGSIGPSIMQNGRFLNDQCSQGLAPARPVLMAIRPSGW